MPSRQGDRGDRPKTLSHKDLPDLRRGHFKPVAFTFGDAHLSLDAPPCRGEGKAWLECQRGYLNQLRDVADRFAAPILFAGDMCQHDASPELINEIMASLPPEVYGIPGNHDLPNHDLARIGESAFWTLVEGGKVEFLNTAVPIEFPGVRVTGFPFGVNIHPPPPKRPNLVEVAIVHDYCWSTGHEFPGAPQDKHVDAWIEKLKGYDIAVFGDNHRGFYYEGPPFGPKIFNGGTFIRRRSDEINYKPMIGCIYNDGTIQPLYLNVRDDKFQEVDDPIGLRNMGVDPEELLVTVRGLRDKVDSFFGACRNFCMARHVPKPVQDKIIEWLYRDKK
jgi:hypothetical protein